MSTPKAIELQDVYTDQIKHVDNINAATILEPTSEPVDIDTPGTSKDIHKENMTNINEKTEESQINLQFFPTISDKLNETIGSYENEDQINETCNIYKRSITISIEFERKEEVDDDIPQNDNIDTENNDNMQIAERKRSSLDISCSQEVENSLELTNMQLPKRQKVSVFMNDSLPQWYHVRGSLVTPPVLPKNLPKAFEGLPIYGKPNSKTDIERFQTKQLREFIGCNLDDEEFDELSKYCSPEHLKTGNELLSKMSIPAPGIFPLIDVTDSDSNANLNILKKYKIRVEQDKRNKFNTKLKYRAVRLIAQSQEENSVSQSDTQLEPGRDILYHVRLYRPYSYILQRERSTRGRHSVFSFDIMLSGRQYLTALRDRIVCNNDLDMRVDVSNTPDALPVTTSKDVFPSGFLFINNVFYVDTREGCSDLSAVIREWAVRRGLGAYRHMDMCKVRLDDIVVKLGYPEVYLHQGNCEHVFTFSEIRLVSARDPLRLAQYPYLPSISQNQTIYCTTCAEFGAKWVVVGCRSVPFDPAFFCDMCFRQYMYKDGRKIGDFKAYSYRGNEINMLKPQG